MSFDSTWDQYQVKSWDSTQVFKLSQNVNMKTWLDNQFTHCKQENHSEQNCWLLHSKLYSDNESLFRKERIWSKKMTLKLVLKLK